MNATLRKLGMPALLVAGTATAMTAADMVKDPLPDLGAQAAGPAVAPPGAIASAEGLSGAFRAATRAALPAVVHVRVASAARAVSSQQVPPEFRGTPFEDMFRRQGGQAPRAGSGSGFIISADGYIITNNHVVEGMDRVMVVLADKREFEARVVGRDPNTDVAVLKVEARGLPVARLGDADVLEIGDWVLALGYPLDLGQTTTAGIVSAKGRSLGIMGRNGAEAPLEHFIQTDAAINPGNSGGPLVDLQGRVIGVNSAIASPTGFYSGYGFAVPVNLARRVAEDLMRDGRVHRPMIGVEIRDVSPADAEVFGLPSPDGAVVSAEPRGPAAAAGLKLGDVIVAVEGKAVKNAGDLMETVMERRPGDRVTLDVVRYGDRRRVAVRLEEFSNPRAARSRAEPAAEDVAAPAETTGRLGFRAEAVTPEIARELGMERAAGVVISEVDPASPAAGVLGRGMVVRRFNGRQVGTVQELRAASEAVRAGQVVSLEVRLPDGRETIVNFRARS
ncbi:MAG TPA: trypsin-like peptidase domain-containing protein [Longimicrobium sp.]|jgi:serine protease Do|uniref:trypsin-like peptidase domain-containing protein n=1 Tax=Longimicrobium sp. TaxID=2029185 RepID=UPI002EDB2FA4